eukprot:jgi/Chlat1/2023/Chrsp158S02309
MARAGALALLAARAACCSAAVSSSASCAAGGRALHTVAAAAASSWSDGGWRAAQESSRTLEQPCCTSRAFHSSGRREAPPKRDLYEVLGVSKTASALDIKKAYYQLAKMYHPDSPESGKDSEAKFQEVQQAYETGHTDAQDFAGGGDYGGFGGFGQGGGGFPGGFENLDDLFGQFGFDLGGGRGGGGFGRRQSRQPDAQIALNVSFMDAVRGGVVRVTVTLPEPCSACDGTGAKKWTQCRDCGGKGARVTQQGFIQMQQVCMTCGGAGRIVQEPCSTCQGEGTVEKPETITVEIPEGVEQGDTLQLRGQGLKDKKGRRGNLNVILQVEPHPDFRREGPDIHVDVNIPVTTAMLGGRVSVPTISGGKVTVRVAPGTQPSEVQVIKGKGVRQRDGRGYGDQYLHFHVKVPKDLTPRQRELLQEFAREDEGEDGEKERRAGSM